MYITTLVLGTWLQYVAILLCVGLAATALADEGMPVKEELRSAAERYEALVRALNEQGRMSVLSSDNIVADFVRLRIHGWTSEEEMLEWEPPPEKAFRRLAAEIGVAWERGPDRSPRFRRVVTEIDGESRPGWPAYLYIRDSWSDEQQQLAERWAKENAPALKVLRNAIRHKKMYYLPIGDEVGQAAELITFAPYEMLLLATKVDLARDDDKGWEKWIDLIRLLDLQGKAINSGLLVAGGYLYRSYAYDLLWNQLEQGTLDSVTARSIQADLLTLDPPLPSDMAKWMLIWPKIEAMNDLRAFEASKDSGLGIHLRVTLGELGVDSDSAKEMIEVMSVDIEAVEQRLDHALAELARGLCFGDASAQLHSTMRTAHEYRPTAKRASALETRFHAIKTDAMRSTDRGLTQEFSRFIADTMLEEVAILRKTDGVVERGWHPILLRRLSVVALGLVRHYQELGMLPERLKETSGETLGVAPIDPVSGRPLGYRRSSPTQAILYSVGFDLTDNNGDLTKDIAIRIAIRSQGTSDTD